MTPLDTTTSLWLTLAGQAPPLGRVRRYDAAIHRMLSPFGTDDVNWPLEVGHQVLGGLAAQMDEAESRITSRAALEASVSQVLEERTGADSQAVQQCLQTLGASSGLLISWGRERLTVSSPVLYAYFRAYQWISDQTTPSLQLRPLDPDRALCLPFLAEMTGSEALLAGLLDAPAGLLQEGLFLAAQSLSGMLEGAGSNGAVLRRLAQVLLDPDAYRALRERAAATLVGTQEDGIGYRLRQAFGSPDPTLRAIAAAGLGSLASGPPGRRGDAQALEALIDGARDPSETVRTAVIHALAATPSKAAAEALIHLLLQAEPPTRQAAAEALARMGKDGHQVLREALDEDDILARRAVLYGLALIEEPWAEHELGAVQHKDSEWRVRTAAQDLLTDRRQEDKSEGIAPTRPEDLAWLVSWAAEQDTGVPKGPRATAMLLRVLQEGSDTARAAAARSLGDVGREEFWEPLSAALRDPSRDVREAAFFALAVIGRAWNRWLPAP